MTAKEHETAVREMLAEARRIARDARRKINAIERKFDKMTDEDSKSIDALMTREFGDYHWEPEADKFLAGLDAARTKFYSEMSDLGYEW